MTVARIARQLDPGDVEEFQRLARILCAHGIVTAEYPRPGLLPAIRRFETVLRNEFNRVLHYRLDVGPSCARLTRRAAALSHRRPARTPTRRVVGRWAYTYICLVLAALESLGEQTTISQLSDEVVRLRSGDAGLLVDLTAADQRRGFVDALRWLEVRGILDVRDGESERFVHDRDADALYDIDRDIASRLLVASPSVLRDVNAAEDFLNEPFGFEEDGTSRHARFAVTRRIVTEPAVYYDELPEDERAYLRQNRGRLLRDIELLLGCVVEARAEGVALIDADVDALAVADDRFPASGGIAHAAMMLTEALLGRVRAEPEGNVASAPPIGHRVETERLRALWDAIVERYATRFTADYRDAPDRLLADALALLERQDLVVCSDDRDAAAGYVVRPALARFAPLVTVVDEQLTFGEIA